MFKRSLAISFTFPLIFLSLFLSPFSYSKESAEYLTELDALLRALEKEGVLPQKSDSLNWKTRLEPVIRDLSLPPIARFSVIGPTKTGKSTTLNTIAERKVSSTHTGAGHTKQSVAIVPKEASDPALMSRMFPGLNVFKGPAKGAEAEKAEAHNLFYEVNPKLSGRIIIDAADLNSNDDHRQKALDVAHVSDVVLFVINQSTYGTRDIQSAFTEILGQDPEIQKPIILLVTGVILPKQEKEWSVWLNDFKLKTGANPLASFIVPYDLVSEGEPNIEFFRVNDDGKTREPKPTDLGAYLNNLNTTELRLRAHQSSVLQALFEAGGAQEVLDELKKRIEKSKELLELANEYSVVKMEDWPVLPARFRFSHINRWWNQKHRLSITQNINWVMGYFRAPGRAVGNFLYRPDPQKDAMVIYKTKEREAVLRIAMQIMKQMGTMVTEHPHLFSQKVKDLFSPSSFSDLSIRLLPAYEASQAVHEREEVFQQLFDDLLNDFEKANPGIIKLVLASDTFFTGLVAPAATTAGTAFGYAGAVSAETVFGTAVKILTQPVNSAVAAGIGGGVAASTEDFIQSVAGQYAVVSLFSDISDRYRVTQAAWVIRWLSENHLKPLHEELGLAQKWESRTELDSAQTCVKMLEGWAHARK